MRKFNQADLCPKEKNKKTSQRIKIKILKKTKTSV